MLNWILTPTQERMANESYRLSAVLAINAQMCPLPLNKLVPTISVNVSTTTIPPSNETTTTTIITNTASQRQGIPIIAQDMSVMLAHSSIQFLDFAASVIHDDFATRFVGGDDYGDVPRRSPQTLQLVQLVGSDPTSLVRAFFSFRNGRFDMAVADCQQYLDYFIQVLGVPEHYYNDLAIAISSMFSVAREHACLFVCVFIWPCVQSIQKLFGDECDFSISVGLTFRSHIELSFEWTIVMRDIAMSMEDLRLANIRLGCILEHTRLTSSTVCHWVYGCRRWLNPSQCVKKSPTQHRSKKRNSNKSSSAATTPPPPPPPIPSFQSSSQYGGGGEDYYPLLPSSPTQPPSSSTSSSSSTKTKQLQQHLPTSCMSMTMMNLDHLQRDGQFVPFIGKTYTIMCPHSDVHQSKSFDSLCELNVCSSNIDKIAARVWTCMRAKNQFTKCVECLDSFFIPVETPSVPRCAPVMTMSPLLSFFSTAEDIRTNAKQIAAAFLIDVAAMSEFGYRIFHIAAATNMPEQILSVDPSIIGMTRSSATTPSSSSMPMGGGGGGAHRSVSSFLNVRGSVFDLCRKYDAIGLTMMGSSFLPSHQQHAHPHQQQQSTIDNSSQCTTTIVVTTSQQQQHPHHPLPNKKKSIAAAAHHNYPSCVNAGHETHIYNEVCRLFSKFGGAELCQISGLATIVSDGAKLSRLNRMLFDPHRHKTSSSPLTPPPLSDVQLRFDEHGNVLSLCITICGGVELVKTVLLEFHGGPSASDFVATNHAILEFCLVDLVFSFEQQQQQQQQRGDVFCCAVVEADLRVREMPIYAHLQRDVAIARGTTPTPATTTLLPIHKKIMTMVFSEQFSENMRSFVRSRFGKKHVQLSLPPSSPFSPPPLSRKKRTTSSLSSLSSPSPPSPLIVAAAAEQQQKKQKREIFMDD